MQFRLLCTDVHSESAARLADKLGELVGYKVFRSDKVIPNRQHIRYGDARDKLTQYSFFKKNNIPHADFTTVRREAEEWIRYGHSVLCRILLRGQEGHGIAVADKKDELVDAPVYVRYLPKTLEYRVNIYRGKLINYREKRKKLGFLGGEARIRSVDNGYVYCIPRTQLPAVVWDAAFKASQITDSDVVGVDVAWNEKNRSGFVLEVNSAPSLEGVTVDEMARAIIDFHKD